MKKLLSIALILVFLCPMMGVNAQDEIKVKLDGETLAFDQSPVEIDGRVLVPLRKIFEVLGATVNYNPETHQVGVVTNNANDLRFYINIGEKSVRFNDGRVETMDVPSMEINGRTLVPVRFVSENCGATVEWDDKQSIVIITTENNSVETDNPPLSDYPRYPEFPSVIDIGVCNGLPIYQKEVESNEYGAGYVYRYIFSAENPKKFIDTYMEYLNKTGFATVKTPEYTTSELSTSYGFMVMQNNVSVTVIHSAFKEANMLSVHIMNRNDYSPAVSNNVYYIFSDDSKRTFLGEINNRNTYGSDNVFNEYGAYGSKYKSDSIWNTYGTYGSKYSQYSAFNDYASSPPIIVTADGKYIGVLTTNKYLNGAISPYELGSL